MPSHFLSIAAGVLAASYLFLLAILRRTQDPDEPSSICDAVPFITPFFKMATEGVAFHQRMRDEFKLPIHTLRMPGSRLYVVNSLSLISSIQRPFRVLSFTAIEAGIAANLIGVNRETQTIMNHHLTQDDGYLMSFPRYVHPALSAGPGLNAMNRTAVQVLSRSFDAHAQRGTSRVSMFSWIRHEIAMATTDAVYGPRNPFRDPKMEESWYTFERGMMVFVLNLLPRILAARAYKAREHMVRCWERYFAAGSHLEGSELIKARVRINEDFNIPLAETARIETGGTQAVLSNTVPGAFWTVYRIFSDPEVLAEVRAELERGVVRRRRHSHAAATATAAIDLGYVTSSCPVLLSTFKETVRLHSTSTATRVAMEDHRLDGRYLLKKGATILVPSPVHHSDRDVWGDSAGEFVHTRFLRPAAAAAAAAGKGAGGPRTKTHPAAAFRGFGGGTTLCPGRHFASTEILMFAALLVLRFDLRPRATKGGETTDVWTQPSTANSPMIHGLPIPDWDLEVELCPRDVGQEWEVSFSGHDGDMEIAAEDVQGSAEVPS